MERYGIDPTSERGPGLSHPFTQLNRIEIGKLFRITPGAPRNYFQLNYLMDAAETLKGATQTVVRGNIQNSCFQYLVAQ